MRVLAAVLLALSAGAAGAGTLPSLFDVTGVAAEDVLNVRAEPDANAPVIGTLAPGATGIEVVSVDPSGHWGEVNVGEGAGWAALRFLAEEPEVWVPGKLPQSLSCFGTEPFWNLRDRDGTAVLEMPEAAKSLGAAVAVDTGIPGDVRRALVAGDPALRVTATVVPQSCGDGMSDRAFGLGAMVLVQEGDGVPRLLTGCCSIAP
jgi:uncharacterized membrane protein